MSDPNKFRVLGWIGVSRQLQKIMEAHVHSTPNGITPSCISCTAFHEQTEICETYNARPPARIIAFGCSSYRDKDDIPF